MNGMKKSTYPKFGRIPLADTEDISLAMRRLKRPNRTYSAEEVKLALRLEKNE